MILKLSDKFVLRDIKGVKLLVPIKKNNLSSLPMIINSTAYFLLENLKQQNDLNHIIILMKKKYNNINTKDIEYIEFYVQELIKKGILYIL